MLAAWHLAGTRLEVPSTWNLDPVSRGFPIHISPIYIYSSAIATGSCTKADRVSIDVQDQTALREWQLAMGVWRDVSSSDSDDDLVLYWGHNGGFFTHISRTKIVLLGLLHTRFPSCLAGAYANSIWLCPLRTSVPECSGLLDSPLRLLGGAWWHSNNIWYPNISKLIKPQYVQGMQGSKR